MSISVKGIQHRIEKSSNTISYLTMILPGVLFIFLFSYVPLFGLSLAFKNFYPRLGVFGSPFVGLENFKFFLSGQNAFSITFNTIFLNFLFIFTGIIFQVGFAILFSEVNKKWFLKFTQSVMFFPHFISWVIVGYLTYALFNMEYGLFNRILVGIGLAEIDWYNEASLWPAILTMVSIWKATGYGCIIYYAGIMGIDTEYYEAATVDGANWWQKVTKITIPLLSPLIIILLLLSIGRIMHSDFGMFYNITRDSGMLYSTTDVLDTFIYRSLRVSNDIGVSSAANFYQAIVGFVLVAVTNVVVRKIDKEKALF